MNSIVRLLGAMAIVFGLGLGTVSASLASADPAYDPYPGPGYKGPEVSSAYTDATGIFVCDGNPGVAQLGCVTNEVASLPLPGWVGLLGLLGSFMIAIIVVLAILLATYALISKAFGAPTVGAVYERMRG